MDTTILRGATASASRTCPRIVAVASGKGGVGKTWFSVSLAQCLALRSRPLRVLVLDGDFGLANVDIQLGLLPQCDLKDVVAGRSSLEDSIVRVPVGDALPGGRAVSFDVLPGHSGMPSLSALGAGQIEDLVASVRELYEYDVILFDLCAGIDVTTRRMAARADTTLVLTTEEPTALTDAYAVIKLLTRDRTSLGFESGDVRLVINQTSSYRSGQRIYDSLARACGAFLGQAPALAGMIRRDGRVSDSIRHQALMALRHPNAPSLQDVQRVAEGLLQTMPAVG
ncbi:AAA family ATPase [Ameyamaea chiangmaiensis]|uniref:AAA family ATPase n=2 Tax=Ameyamaea chiangmaiensis TaxID=442969 RepID=A0A850P8A5_9PROT|nr:AAA family ATPase [Ameyamaea chiangmaiensis]NVN40138.1 AAA family ATPase [Ameyamaea chiangmaiensis]